MKTYTKEQFLLAAELGEVSMIDAKHIVSLLDEAVEKESCNHTFIQKDSYWKVCSKG